MASLGKDLASIREHLGYSIQDIQNSTKIPLNTLQAIETGAIFTQSDEIKTYVRSFVRSYGRALKLDDEILVKALDQQEAGSYNHLVLKDFPELYAEVEPKKPAEEEEKAPPTPPAEEKKPQITKDSPMPDEVPPAAKEEQDKDEVKDEAEAGGKKIEKEKKKEQKNVKAKPEFNPAPDPGVRNVNWADMGRRFSIADQKSTPVWIIGGVIIIALVLAAAYFLFENDYFASDTPPEQPVPEQPSTQNEGSQDLQLDITDSPSGEAETAAELEDTLYLTIYAATDKLEPVRVWSDLKTGIDPYWMNQGTAYNFEFADTIRVRGQYSRMLLFLNGHLITDFRQNYYNSSENSVELTRSIFEEDDRWAAPVPLEVPENIAEPDTIVNRPSF